MNLLISLRSEVLKTKRTASFYLTLIGAAVVPFIFLLNVTMEGLSDVRKDPMNSIFKLGAEMNGVLIFPIFVILICTLLPQIEFKNNTWKQVLTSPQSRVEIFIAKIVNIHLLIFLFLIANLVFMYMAAVVAHFVDPTLDLLNQPFDVKRVLTNSINSYLSILAICAIQYWLGLRFKNFVIPVSIGLALWLGGTIMTMEYKAAFSVYFPYSFHLYGFVPHLKGQLNEVVVTSFIYCVLFLTIGLLDFRWRRMHS